MLGRQSRTFLAQESDLDPCEHSQKVVAKFLIRGHRDRNVELMEQSRHGLVNHELCEMAAWTCPRAASKYKTVFVHGPSPRVVGL